MPELSFVLPHWLYWGGLALFPLAAMFLYRRGRHRTPERPVSLALGYFLLITGGFLGVHRLYLKSRWAVVFMALFLVVLFVNLESRAARDGVSEANNAVSLSESRITRGERAIGKTEKKLARRDTESQRKKLAEQRARLAEYQAALPRVRSMQDEARTRADRWIGIAGALGLVILALVLVDAVLLPKLVRERNDLEIGIRADEGFQCPAVEKGHVDSREPFAFGRAISRLNGLTGDFVAYWSIIAVFVYYYEVMARYVFNSPTNWAHESMFLMFGAQYLIAGGFCLRENAHVRVDVLYMHLSKRAKAIMDLITSVFFFIFMLTLLITGWIFFKDAFDVQEVSFTEWGIQYWPVKFALPLGAILLMLQGIAQLAKDIAVVVRPESAELDTEVRPEG